MNCRSHDEAEQGSRYQHKWHPEEGREKVAEKNTLDPVVQGLWKRVAVRQDYREDGTLAGITLSKCE
jgi:hypothetical protein